MSRLSVLLTGAAGNIGQCLLPALREVYDLRVADVRPVPGAPDAVRMDLADPAAVRAAVDGIEVIVHLAATSVESSFADELLPNNIVGLQNLLRAAVAAKVRRVVFASTAQTVARYPSTATVRIADPIRPCSIYAVTKVFGEALGRFYHEQNGLEFIAIRIGGYQAYANVDEAKRPWVRSLWLGPRDCVKLFRLAVEKPGLGYAVVFGRSRTLVDFLSLDEARAVLGYEPEEDLRDYLHGISRCTA